MDRLAALPAAGGVASWPCCGNALGLNFPVGAAAGAGGEEEEGGGATLCGGGSGGADAVGDADRTPLVAPLAALRDTDTTFLVLGAGTTTRFFSFGLVLPRRLFKEEEEEEEEEGGEEEEGKHKCCNHVTYPHSVWNGKHKHSYSYHKTCVHDLHGFNFNHGDLVLINKRAVVWRALKVV